MKKQISLVIICSLCCIASYAQMGVALEKTFGGTLNDLGFDMEQTTGGYILAGHSSSSDDDVTGSLGAQDFWVLEIDTNTNILWQKSYGGTANDYCTDLLPSGDGGWILAGSTLSVDGDITDNAGEKDGWIFKIEADGDILWQFTYGGPSDDQINGVIPTTDGGFLCMGESKSVSGDVESNAGLDDVWILKLNADGEMEWVKNYGGTKKDVAYSAVELSDGYIIVGSAASTDGDVVGNHSEAGEFKEDYWVLRLETDGDLVWATCYGGTKDEDAREILLTADGTYFIGGSAKSNDGDVSAHYGEVSRYDFWVIEIDEDGTLLVNKNFGGSNNDNLYDMVPDLDGNYILTGQTASADNDVIGHHGSGSTTDFWIAIIDADLNVVTTSSLGGTQDDVGQKVIPLGVNNYVGAGFTKSEDDDVSYHHGGAGNQDFWFVKLGECTLTITDEPDDIVACEGSDVTLTIEATGGASSYVWDFVSGPDFTTSTNYLILNDVTTAYSHLYYVYVSGACGADTSIEATLEIVVFAVPDISPAGPISLCGSDPVTLSTSTFDPDYTYQWQKDGVDIDDATEMSYTVDDAGSYTVTISNSMGCSSTSATVVVTSEGLATVITAVGSTNICATGSVTLNASASAGLTYQWYSGATAITGATSSSYAATAPGSYSCVVDSLGCLSNSNTIVVTLEYPIATISVSGSLDLYPAGSVTLNSTTIGTSLAYQWLKDNLPIPSAVGTTLIATEVGDYALVATNLQGCPDTSNTLNVFNSYVDIDEINPFAVFSIIPNPNNGNFIIELAQVEAADDIQLSIMNMQGQIMFAQTVAASEKIELPMQLQLPAGSYFVRVMNEESVIIRKFIVQN